MREEKIVTIEEPEEIERVEGNLTAPGIYGETDRVAFADRARRVERAKARVDWRDCISCEHCTCCVELRKFTKDGKVQSSMFCLALEMETTFYKTCNQSHRNRSGRRKVIYDLENAPIDFGQKIAPYVVERDDYKQTDVTRPPEGYRGGSKYYKRGEGEDGKEGAAEMPKRLMN